ncbi:MAG TPA: hypothetical protein PK176_11200 [Acidobacteriota bacterium]|nr:hypothetical protein [Acidobacteriota bacterium]HQM63870.1 hypothetical protein [Acidobacteriota bacterium]
MLTLYEVVRGGEWGQSIAESAERAGYLSERLFFWRPADLTPVSGPVAFADGVQVERLDIGLAGRCHVCIVPRRRFFSGRRPYRGPKSTLFGSMAEPGYPPPGRRIAAVREFAAMLAKQRVVAPQPVPTEEWPQTDPLAQLDFRLGPGRVPVSIRACRNLASQLRRHGPVAVQPQFKVALTAPEENPVADYYADQLRRYFRDAGLPDEWLVRRKWPEILDWVGRVRARARAGVQNKLVCIGLHGRTGDPVQPDVLALMRELDDVGASYRLFSLDTPESGLYNAVLNQLPVFLMSAGGTAYEVDLHLPGADADCYFLGIDIGHNPEAPESKPVFTLVDSRGRLLRYWVIPQRRDETLHRRTVDAGLRQAAAYLDTVAPARRLVIMRDGRMFRHERLDEYRRHVGDAFSFLEVIKHPVPMMLDGARASAPGTVLKPRGGNCYFLMTADSPVSSHINHPLKVRVVHDGLGLGDPKLLDCVLGLCYAPSLGVRPTRSPSPIYWADGVSKISDTNHQFSGLNFARSER